MGIEPRTSAIPVWHPPIWANLALLVRLRLLRSLYSHALLILTKSSKSKNLLVHQQVKLNIPQLALSLDRTGLDFNGRDLG